MSKLKNPAIWLLIATITVSAIVAPSISAQQGSQITFDGPYVDKIIFRVIRGSDQRLLALEKGEIDLVADFLDPAQLPRAQANPNIEVARTDRRGYGYGAWNNARFPGNISDFRQAVAYALDKNRISTEAWAGLSRPIDLPVPPSMGVWSYEDQLPEHYYDANPAPAMELLEKAGFVDVNGDGMREYQGQPFTLQAYASAGVPVQEVQLAILKENLKAVGINVLTRFVDFNTLLNRIDSGDFNLVFLGISLGGFDADYLIDLFKCDSEYNLGFYRYCNPEVDELLTKLENSESFEEAVKWSWEVQKILWKEQPVLPTYMNLLLSAYRTDKFEGYQNIPGDGVASGLTYIKVRLKDGSVGGEFRVAIPEPVESQNVLASNSAYTYEVMARVYDGLGIDRNPYTLEWMGYLASDWEIQKAADGGTDLTVTYFPNIKWHDGTPFTAEDVKFSYEMEQQVEAPFVIDGIRAVDKVEVMDPLKVYIHSTKGGYFESTRMQGIWLLPKHIWETIPPENVLSYRNEKPVGTGSFMYEQAVPGEFYVVSYFKDGIWLPKERGGNPPSPVVKTTTTAPPPPTTQPPPPPPTTVTTPIATGTETGAAPGLPSELLLVAAVVVIIVLIAGYMYTRRKKPASSETGTSTS